MKLSASEIDACSEKLGEDLGAEGVTRRNINNIRLTVEEALIRMREHFGEEAEVKVEMRKSLSGSFVRISHDGKAYNPMGQDSEDSAVNAWSESLANSIGLRPQYSYVNGSNIIRIPFPRAVISPAKSLLLGIAAGLAVGILGNWLVPDYAQYLVTTIFFKPLFNLWTRMLNALAAPVVFLMVLTTLLNMREVSTHGGNNRLITFRYFAISYLLSALAVAVTVLLFRVPVAGESLSSKLVSNAFRTVTSIVPENIVDPFITSNTPQLLLLVFILAAALAALNEQVQETIKFIRQCNMVSLLVTKWVSSLVPFVTGSMLAMEIWDNIPDTLIDMWKPLLLSVVITLLFMVVEFLLISKRYDVKPMNLVRKVWTPFLVTVKKGNLDDSYGDAEYSCAQGLGISRKFTEVVLPQGLVMYMPASFIGTLIFTVLVARQTGVDINVSWLVMAIVMDVVVFVATPPVPGANLLAFITLFGALNIPETALLDAMVFDILYGLFANAANQTLLQMEMIRQADRLGMLSRKKLRKESA